MANFLEHFSVQGPCTAVGWGAGCYSALPILHPDLPVSDQVFDLLESRLQTVVLFEPPLSLFDWAIKTPSQADAIRSLGDKNKIDQYLSAFFTHSDTFWSTRDPNGLSSIPDGDLAPVVDSMDDALRGSASEAANDKILATLDDPAFGQACRTVAKRCYARSDRLRQAKLRHVCGQRSIATSHVAYWLSKELYESVTDRRETSFAVQPDLNYFGHVASPLATLRSWLQVSDPIDQSCKDFASSVMLPTSFRRPWFTVTWAQSLDGRMAAHPGHPRLIISGQESMQMTFRLRARHQAIMVTGTTLNADNSQLTIRQIPECQEPGFRQPVPFILDPLLVSDPKNRLFQTGRSPRILCLSSSLGLGRAEALRQSGNLLVGFDPTPGTNRIPFEAISDYIYGTEGISSVLIEPGVRFLPALFEHPELLDAVVVTVGPGIIASDGLGPDWGRTRKPKLKAINTLQLGHDFVTGSHLVHGEATAA